MSATEKKQVQELTPDSFGLNPDLVHFLTDAINQGDIARIKDHVKGMHAADLADFINQISPDQRETLLNVIDEKLEFEPEVLIDLENEVKDEVIDQLGAEKSAEAIVQLDSDDAVQVMEDLQVDEQKEILNAIPDKEQRAELRQGLAYPEDSAGRIMETNFVSIPKSWDVGKTIDFLRVENKDLPSDFFQIFVVNRKGEPIGGVLLSRILRNKRSININSLMEKEIKTVNVNSDQEEVAYIFRKYGLASAPVVDGRGKMIGMITVNDIVDVMEEEAEEDIMRMGGIKETDLFTPFSQTAGRRFPWLFINLLTAIAASAVIALFEHTIEQIVALAVLMPIVASMAGNAGTQTLTIAVRGLATKELTSTNAKRVVYKEIAVGLLNGIGFALIVGVISYVYYLDLHLSLVFAISTTVALIIAGFAGAIIPIVLERANVDPALASTVFLTTITDVTAFFIFLGLAAYLLL